MALSWGQQESERILEWSERALELNCKTNTEVRIAKLTADKCVLQRQASKISLGCEETNSFLTYFLGLLKNAQQFAEKEPERGYYIAVMTRRCHVLCEVAYENIQYSLLAQDEDDIPVWLKNVDRERLKAQIDEHFITDTALLNMGCELAEYYRTNGFFPRLWLVDELMIHGRALNGVIYKLERILVRELEGKAARETVMEALEDALAVCVYAANSQQILMLPRYKTLLKAEKFCEPIQWRKFSMDLAHFVAGSAVNNVAFSWGYEKSVSPTDMSAYREKQDEEKHGVFHRVRTTLQNMLQDNYIFLYPNYQEPKAICTVRTKIVPFNADETRAGRAGIQLLVPFIIFDNLSIDRVWELHCRLVEDTREFEKINKLLRRHDSKMQEAPDLREALYARWLQETNELLLNALLMKLFAQSVPEGSFTPSDINYAQLARNFIPFSEEQKPFEEIVEELRQIWEWQSGKSVETLWSYLDLLLQDAKPITIESDDIRAKKESVQWAEKKQREYVQCAVENAIAIVGYEAEKNAYRHYSNIGSYSEETLTQWGDKHSITTLIAKCRDELNIYFEGEDRSANLYQICAVVVHAMDYGLLGMNTVIGRHPCKDNLTFIQQERALYTEQRAGEAALFIWPTRYRNCMPVLESIAQTYGFGTGISALEIDWFVARLEQQEEWDFIETPGIVEHNLQRLFKLLLESGQRFEDWQFTIHEYTDNLAALRKTVVHDLNTQNEYMNI